MDLIPIWLTAIGTLLVAVAAIWGEWLRSKLASPRLRIEDHNFRGTLERFPNGSRAVFYHLQVKNLRRWVAAKNCRVLLVGIHRRGPDGRFIQEPLPVPFQFIWSPAEFSSVLQAVSDRNVFDFGSVIEKSQHFIPSLYTVPYEFRGRVGPNEAARYTLQVIADNFVSQNFVYEVAWNGQWSDNLDNMQQNLTIAKIPNGDKP